MTHYHYYIQAGAQLDALSRFYLVAIGNSVQANRDYLFLLSHSVDAGHYFEIRSEESTDFVQRCLQSLSDDAAQFDCVAPILQKIKARDLVRLIKAETAASLSPGSPSEPRIP